MSPTMVVEAMFGLVPVPVPKCVCVFIKTTHKTEKDLYVKKSNILIERNPDFGPRRLIRSPSRGRQPADVVDGRGAGQEDGRRVSPAGGDHAPALPDRRPAEEGQVGDYRTQTVHLRGERWVGGWVTVICNTFIIPQIGLLSDVGSLNAFRRVWYSHSLSLNAG